jgi:DNA-binding PadR family transcriptional regulator
VDSQHANAVRKAVLAVLYENRDDDLSVGRLYIKVLRHMLPKMPEEQVVKSVLDKLVKEGFVNFEKDNTTSDIIVKLSSKGIELSEKELEQFKRTIDKLATKLSNTRQY